MYGIRSMEVRSMRGNEEWQKLPRTVKWNLLAAYNCALRAQANNRCADPADGGCIPSYSCHYETGKNIRNELAVVLQHYGLETSRDIDLEWEQVSK
jgi:hypothetical protein